MINYDRHVKAFSFHHAVASGIAVMAALIVQHLYSFSHEYWMALAALLVSQTTKGTPLRQGLIFMMLIVSAVLIASLLRSNLHSITVIIAVGVFLFLLCATVVFLMRPLSTQRVFLIMLFPIVLMIASLSPLASPDASLLIQARVGDVIIGCLIGIVCVNLIFPVSMSKEFSEDITPILYALKEQAAEWILSIQEKKPMEHTLNPIKNILCGYQSRYPEWVYELGFNRGLRSGFRFFLVHLEKMTEIFFSMEHLFFFIKKDNDESLLDELSPYLVKVMQQNDELIHILIDYFSGHSLKEPSKELRRELKSDFTSDIAELEKALQQLIPPTLEWLDISKKSLLLTALVRDIRDLRGLLLQLVAALP